MPSAPTLGAVRRSKTLGKNMQWVQTEEDMEDAGEGISPLSSPARRKARVERGLAASRNAITSASMPALSEYFSLEMSQPTSTTPYEYLALIADDEDEGIIF